MLSADVGGRPELSRKPWSWKDRGRRTYITGMPKTGQLRVSLLETAQKCIPLEEESFQRLLQLLQVDSTDADMPRLKLLSAVASLLWLDAEQLKQIVQVFSKGEAQAEACATLYSRVVTKQMEPPLSKAELAAHKAEAEEKGWLNGKDPNAIPEWQQVQSACTAAVGKDHFPLLRPKVCTYERLWLGLSWLAAGRAVVDFREGEHLRSLSH